MLMRVTKFPLPLLTIGALSVLMIAPAFLALTNEAFHTARAFFYAALLGVFIVALIAIAIRDRLKISQDSELFLGLVFSLLILPLVAAIPFFEALRTTSLLNAYFEMFSALSTTGLTVYDAERLSDSLHLWRSIVTWYGGAIAWVAAIAVLAPMDLGGFEVIAITPETKPLNGLVKRRSPPVARIAKAIELLIPIYVAATVMLAAGLVFLGDTPLVAISHAMATLATSAISPVNDLSDAASGRAGEVLIFICFIFAISRGYFGGEFWGTRARPIRNDAEMHVALMIIGILTAIMFFRSWFVITIYENDHTVGNALQAFWGDLFTLTSFLTTTGFISTDWYVSEMWSGLGAPGMLLLFVALIGGGVGTTAGGVKLLRIYALYHSSARELHAMIHPSAVNAKDSVSGFMSRDVSFVTWVFFMIFVLSLTLLTLAISAFGIEFELAITLAIGTLSTTGPVIDVMFGQAIDLNALPAGVKLLACFGMLLGRLECLAFLAFFFRDITQR